MAKVILFVLMCATLIGLGSCASIFWNTTNANGGSWTDGRNWQNGTAPGANDCAYVSATGQILIPAGVSVGNVTFTGSGAAIFISGGTFTVNGVLALRSNINLRVDTGATLSVGAHLEIGASGISFTLYGTATAAAIKTTGSLTYPNGIQNDGPSSVLLTGALGHVVDTDFLITANTFTFSQSATHNFYQTSPTGGSNTLTFTYTPTITIFNALNNYYNPIPVAFSFLQGVNFLNANPIAISNSTGIKAPITFQGTMTLSAATTNIAAVPTFKGTTVVINGGVLTFADVSPTFTGSSQLIGTGGLSFASTDSNGRTATFSGTVNVNLPTFTFSRTGTPIPPNWVLTGGTVNINSPFTIATVFTVSNTLTFSLPVTINTGGHLRGGGSVTFVDGIINNGGTQPWTFSPTFKCNANNFNVTGTGSISLLAGVTIAGCTINTQTTNQITVNSPIAVTTANATIDVTQVNLNISGTTGFTFSGVNGLNPLFSLTIKSPIQNIPVNFTFTATDIDVVLNSTLGFIFGTTLSGNGFFTLNGGLTLGDLNVISAGTTVALPSGPYAINPTNTQALSTAFNGKLLLRNTILSGTGQINFNGQLIILNGLSYINTNNFVINAPLTVTYQSNQTTPITFPENPTLVFSAGATRSLNNGVTASNKVAIVFNDGLTLTTSLSFTSTAAGASITFNQSTAQVFTLNGQVTDQYTVNGNTIFNSTSNRFINNGLFNINGNVTTMGTFNNPQQTNDATVILAPTFIVAAANTIFGPTVLLGSGNFGTDDSDRNSSTALTSVTFNYTVGTTYPIPGNAYTFLTNVTFLGPVLFKSTTTVTFTGSTGFLIFNGNCMLVQSNINFNIRTVFANPLNISDNSQNTAFTVTVNGANQPSTNDGLWIGGNLFLNLGITLNIADSVNVYFLTSLNVFGTGTLTTNSANFIGNNAVVNIQPLIVNLVGGSGKSTTFFGSGSTTYNFTPFNSNGNFFTNIVANVPVNYNGATVTLNGQTTFPTAFAFTNTTTTFTGTGPLIFSGVRTLNNNNAYVFNNIASVQFLNTVNLGTAVPFTSTGTTATTITFLYDVNLSIGVTIPLSVTFGQNTFSSVTVSGNTLTLTGPTITVNGNVIITSSIVSNKVSSGNIQTVSGNAAFFGNLWSFNVPVCFTGTFNFTTPISFTQPHILKGGLPTALTFPQGLSFTNVGGLSGSGQICLFGYLNNTLTTAVTVAPGVTVTTAGTPFLVTGNFFINGTYSCRGQVTFANGITFGYNTNLGSSNPINFNDNCQWLGQTSTITIYRSTLNVNKLTTINTPIVLACANTSATTFVGASATTLFINNDITVSAPIVNLNSASLGPINIITTYFLANINSVNPTNVLTFNSVPASAEPIVTIAPALSQPLNLLAPVRFDGLSVGQNAAIYSTNGAGRADLGVSFTATATVSISVPTNLFVTSNATGTVFTVTLSGTRTVLSLSPSLNNPFFTGFTAPSFVFNVAQDDVVRFTTTGTLSFNNVRATGNGVTRFSTGTFSLAGTLQVDAGAIFWQDLATITAFNTTVVAAPNSGANPGFYQVTVGSAAPPTVTSQYALYGGSGIVYLSGYTATTTQTFNIFSTSVAAFGNVLAPVVGTPGYSYSYSRNGNGLTLTITPNAGPIPIPTQSNGPAPPVSAAPSQIFSFVVLFVSFVLVFIC